MEPKQAVTAARAIMAAADLQDLAAIADALEALWVEAAPDASPQLEPGQAKLLRDWGIEDPEFRAVGTSLQVLRAIGSEVGRPARRQVEAHLPLTRLLWDEYGREGRIVAAVTLGPMQLAKPEAVVPVLYEMAHTCVFWEDCDQLAMKALEPVLRRAPDRWLAHLAAWVTDDNKWVRRAGITAIGRLPMVHPKYAASCVDCLAPSLGDSDTDVKRALSFALRTCARGDTGPVKAFVLANRHHCDADSVWVLCDVIRSLWRKLLPEFVELLPVYRAWLGSAEPKVQRSVRSAIALLESAG